MTIAPNSTPLVAARPAPETTAAETAVADVTTLLPSREAVLERLARQPLTIDHSPVTLMIIGLLRRDDGWPTAQDTLARVTTLLARSLRGDDWLGKTGPGEFAVLLAGPSAAAETAAARLVAAIPGLGVPGLAAAVGIAAGASDVDATEVLRRGLLSLTAARRVGAGTVIRYREPN